MLLEQDSNCRCLDNSVKTNQNSQKTQHLSITVCLLAGFFVAEWSVGFWSGSLSLQADAEHILSDIAALGISLFASWLVQQPAAARATFGLRRIEIMAALVNGLSLLVIAIFICWEAIHRFQSPQEISSLPMLAVAMLGLIVNLLNITLLHPHSHDDLNLRGAVLHIIADTASSVGVMVAAIVIHFWNWLWADTAISLVVAGFMILSALPLVRESLSILLEYAPKSINPGDVEVFLKSFPDVLQVEKLYIWRISREQIMLCAHLSVDCATVEQRDRLVGQLQTHLERTFGINQITLQLTHPKSLAVMPIHPLFKQDLISMLSVEKK
ncbi:cation transporter [Brasilonema sp. CT11]|nr:cation transporter [Brasilonema sp. CT11]